MGKIKNLVIEICDLYDRQGMTIIQIASYMDMTEEEVFQIVSDYSSSFNVA